MRVAPPGFQRGTKNCATSAPRAADAAIDERHQTARPARSTAGVAAQKSRAAACAGVGSGSRRRVQRKIASVASTASAAPLIRVQSRMDAVSGAEKSIGCAQLIPRRSRSSQFALPSYFRGVRRTAAGVDPRDYRGGAEDAEIFLTQILRALRASA